MFNTCMKTLAVTLGMAALIGPASAAPNGFLGDVQLGGYNFCPRGTAFASGGLLPIAQNTALFSVLGTTYGGDGRTTFALPNLNGRVAMGTKTNIQPNLQLGQKWGFEQKVLTTAELPNHSHSLTFGPTPAITSESPVGHGLATYPDSADAYVLSGTDGGNMAAQLVDNTGSAASFNVIAPTQALTWCVTTQGQYPSRN